MGRQKHQIYAPILQNNNTEIYSTHNEGKPAVAEILMRNLKIVSATFKRITIFKQQSLSFHVVSKTFITQNYLFVIPNHILCFTCPYHSYLAHFKTSDNRGKHNFEKQYCGGNYSDDLYQCLNTDQILLKIQYFDDSRRRFQIIE